MLIKLKELEGETDPQCISESDEERFTPGTDLLSKEIIRKVKKIQQNEEVMRQIELLGVCLVILAFFVVESMIELVSLWEISILSIAKVVLTLVDTGMIIVIARTLARNKRKKLLSVRYSEIVFIIT